jgi:hypothetical protein
MGAHSVGELVLACAGLGVLVWLLAKLGHLLGKLAEALARVSGFGRR